MLISHFDVEIYAINRIGLEVIGLGMGLEIADRGIWYWNKVKISP